MMDNSAEILFQSFLQEALVSSSGIGRDVHSFVLSIQHSSANHGGITHPPICLEGWFDLALHPVVGLVIQVEDAKKFPQTLGFEGLDPFLRVSKYCSCFTAKRRWQKICTAWTCLWSWWCCTARSSLVWPLLRQSWCRLLWSRCHPCTGLLPGPSFMKCPYHALNDFLRGAQYGNREGCYSCFRGFFRDAQYPCSRRNLYLLPPWCRALLPHIKPCLYQASWSWLAGLNFHAMLMSQHRASDPTDWPWHIAAHLFYLNLALPLQSVNVWRECKINVSVCERYTINCGIPSIQNAQMDLTD